MLAFCLRFYTATQGWPAKSTKKRPVCACIFQLPRVAHEHKGDLWPALETRGDHMTLKTFRALKGGDKIGAITCSLPGCVTGVHRDRGGAITCSVTDYVVGACRPVWLRSVGLVGVVGTRPGCRYYCWKPAEVQDSREMMCELFFGFTHIDMKRNQSES